MRAILCSAFLLSATCLGMADANAQYGGRQRGGTGAGESARRDPSRNESATKPGPAAAAADPMLAIEREMTSMRIDLKLTFEQIALFDSLEREVRNAARASRERTRQIAGFRVDDGSTVAATSIITTIVDADTRRADSMREVAVKLDALQAAFSPELRKQFDRRIMQAIRDPLGTS